MKKGRKKLAISAGIIFAIMGAFLILGGKSCRQEVSIDLNSGDLRKEMRIFSWVLSDTVEQTHFSSAAREAGFEPDPSQRNWKIAIIKYYFDRHTENSTISSAPTMLDNLAMNWELHSTPAYKRKGQAEQALKIVRQNQEPVLKLPDSFQ